MIPKAEKKKNMFLKMRKKYEKNVVRNKQRNKCLYNIFQLMFLNESIRGQCYQQFFYAGVKKVVRFET